MIRNGLLHHDIQRNINLNIDNTGQEQGNCQQKRQHPGRKTVSRPEESIAD